MRSTSRRLGLALFAVLFGALGACRSALEAEASLDGSKATQEEATAAAPTPPAPKGAKAALLDSGPYTIADVSERAIPSVVNIATKKKIRGRAPQMSPFESDPLFRHFFGPGPRRGPAPRAPGRLAQSLGSGVIVGAEGVIVTNNHVVEDAEEVTVTLHDKREYKAEVVGTDPPSDLAVLKLEDPPDDLTALEFGDSDALRLGEVVVAIGNPFGVGQTVTMGIVSAKGRANMGIVDYEDFIQTDAAINPGNSGGALLDLRGKLVGINTAILSRSGGNQGIGFAIPANMAKSIVDSLLEDGEVVRGYLGVMIQDLTPELAEAMDLEGTQGALVSEVLEGSPAAEGGLEAGDVITAVDGRAVAGSARLRNIVASMGAGRAVELSVVRDGEAQKVTVRLEAKAKGGAASGPAAAPAEGPLAGLALAPLDDEHRARFDVAERVTSGVVVTDVERGSAAARAGLRPGDVIVGVNRTRVGAPDDLREAIEDTSGKVLLRVHRGGGTLFVVLER